MAPAVPAELPEPPLLPQSDKMPRTPITAARLTPLEASNVNPEDNTRSLLMERPRRTARSCAPEGGPFYSTDGLVHLMLVKPCATRRVIERIPTVHATLRRQQRDIVGFLRDACVAKLHGHQAPSLLSTPPLSVQLEA